MRTFSYTLTSLILKAKVGSTLFWPSKDEKTATLPHRPFLKELDVDFNTVAPSGAWYFTGEYEDHEDDDPDEEVIGDDDREYNY